MFVYGIRCAPADISYLPENAEADYYLDYGLLIFPHYTRPGLLIGYGNDYFWDSVKLLAEQPSRPHMVVASPEHPPLSEGERAVLKEIQRAFPMTRAAWYNVPRVANQQQGAGPADC